MKKAFVTIVLAAAVVAFAASSMPGKQPIDLTCDNQVLVIYGWCGTASALWDRFEIYFHDGTGEMWGTWWRGETLGGWIDGTGEWDPEEYRILGSGTFSGDDSGYWGGVFYPYGRCSGTVSNPDAIGTFRGGPCE